MSVGHAGCDTPECRHISAIVNLIKKATVIDIVSFYWVLLGVIVTSDYLSSISISVQYVVLNTNGRALSIHMFIIINITLTFGLCGKKKQ